MKAKVSMAVMAIFAFIVIFGCSKQEQPIKEEPLPEPETVVKNEQGFDYLFYEEDSIVFALNKDKKISFKSSPQVFFVSKWNTPDLFLTPDSTWTGCAWDGCGFTGYDEGDGFVYYYSEYHAYSDKFKKETGDSIIQVIKKFPRDGVTRDVRQTCWWLATVKEYDYKTLEEGLRNMTCMSEGYDNYINCLVEIVQSYPGETDKEKIMAFTQEIRIDKPSQWDAWNWPGYY